MSTTSSSSSSSSAAATKAPGPQKRSHGPLWPAFEPWSCDSLMEESDDLCEDLQVTEGSLMIEGIRVVYWKYSATSTSTSSSSKKKKYPLVIVPGGPSMPHFYLLNLKQQACLGERDVYFYDPAGCGLSREETSSNSNSTTTSMAMHPHLLHLTYYATQELPALLDHWKLLDDQFHLFGHAEGGIISMLFALNNNNNIASMTLASAYADKKLFVQSQWDPKTGTIGRLPVHVQQRLATLLAQGNFYSTVEYWEIMKYIYRSFYSRTHPSPICLVQTLETSNWRIMTSIIGPAGNLWDTNNGTLPHDWNIPPKDLKKLTMPTLLITGGDQFDIVRPQVTDQLQQYIPNTERIEIYNAAHMTPIDDPTAVNSALADFIHRVETSRRFKPQKPSSISSSFTGLQDIIDKKSTSTTTNTNTNTNTLVTKNGSNNNNTTQGHPFSNFVLFVFIICGGIILLRKHQAKAAIRANYAQVPSQLHV